MTAAPRGVVRRASAFFTFAFVAASSINILPQSWLMAQGLERKGLVLSSLLLAGTVGATAGISLSRRQLHEAHQPSLRRSLWITPLFVLPLLAVVAGVRPLLVYGALYVVFRAASNWLYNHLDHLLLAGLQGPAVRRHATASTTFQILGQMSGPAVFALLLGQPLVSIGVLLLAFAWSTLAVLDAPAPVAAPSHAEAAPQPTGRLRGPALRLLGWSLVLQTGIIGLFAQLIFLLGDYVGVDSPAKTGGVLIGVVGLSSVAVVAASARLGAGLGRRWSLAWPGLSMAACVVGLWMRPPLWGLVVCAVLAGVGGGRFLLVSRLRASAWQGPPGRATVLSLYNNIPNYASLVAYGLLGSIALVPGEAHPAYHSVVLGLLLILYLAGAGIPLLWPLESVDG